MSWKQIPGFGNYQASDDGRIRNKTGHVINQIWRPTLQAWVVNLWVPGRRVKTKTVAELVLDAFLGRPEGWDGSAGYKDGDHNNLRLDNLYHILEKKRELPRDLNNDGVVLLWRAICQQAIEDLHHGMHPRYDEDVRNAADAEIFITKDIWLFLDEEPNDKTIAEVRRKAETYNKVIRTTLTKPEDNRPERYRPPQHKKRCMSCMYSSFDRDLGIATTSKILHVICDYIGHTGRKRPCRCEECTVYRRRE